MVFALVCAAQKPNVAGTISSTASIEIDGTAMAPAPSWPLVDRDEVGTTSSPALLLTPDQNAITLAAQTKVRIRVLPEHQTWLYVREGGLSFETRTSNVLICMANHVFQPAAQTKGSLILEKSGLVTRRAARNAFNEKETRLCNEEGPINLLTSGASAGASGASSGGAVAGGTASGAATVAGGTAAGAATAGTTIAAGVLAGSAAATGAVSAAGTVGSPCTSGAGCNFNPVAVSPSTP
jgi:hypothetical protein